MKLYVWGPLGVTSLLFCSCIIQIVGGQDVDTTPITSDTAPSVDDAPTDSTPPSAEDPPGSSEDGSASTEDGTVLSEDATPTSDDTSTPEDTESETETLTEATLTESPAPLPDEPPEQSAPTEDSLPTESAITEDAPADDSPQEVPEETPTADEPESATTEITMRSPGEPAAPPGPTPPRDTGENQFECPSGTRFIGWANDCLYLCVRNGVVSPGAVLYLRWTRFSLSYPPYVSRQFAKQKPCELAVSNSKTLKGVCRETLTQFGRTPYCHLRPRANKRRRAKKLPW